VSPTATPTTGVPRAMWIGFALITGVLVAAAAGLLSAAGGVPVPVAILAGGSAGAAAVGLFITLVRYATADGA
jgi:hypothetical protein